MRNLLRTGLSTLLFSTFTIGCGQLPPAGNDPMHAPASAIDIAANGEDDASQSDGAPEAPNSPAADAPEEYGGQDEPQDDSEPAAPEQDDESQDGSEPAAPEQDDGTPDPGSDDNSPKFPKGSDLEIVDDDKEDDDLNLGFCASNADCNAYQFCEKFSCGALLGQCRTTVASVPFAPVNKAPQCGCDGVTYYNPSNRQQAGVSVRHDGECVKNDSKTQSCTPGQNDCAGGSQCVVELWIPNLCTLSESVIPGRCWSLPYYCPSSSVNDTYFSCDDSGALSFCQAAKTGRAVKTS
jgi:hypothetical protein